MAAYALKSRVALHAASVAKDWDLAPLTGELLTLTCCGMTLTDANNYYLECINASKAIIDNSGKQLYKPNRRIVQKLPMNFQTIFRNPNAADVEVIFQKSHIDGSATGPTRFTVPICGFSLSKPK